MQSTARNGDTNLSSPSAAPQATSSTSTTEENNGLPKFGVQAGRSRSSSKMTKTIECWGADKPFANIAENTLAKTVGLAVSRMLNVSFVRCTYI